MSIVEGPRTRTASSKVKFNQELVPPPKTSTPRKRKRPHAEDDVAAATPSAPSKKSGHRKGARKYISLALLTHTCAGRYVTQNALDDDVAHFPCFLSISLRWFSCWYRGRQPRKKQTVQTSKEDEGGQDEGPRYGTI